MQLFFNKILIIGFEDSFRVQQLKKIYSDFDIEIIPAFNGKLLKGIGEKKERRSPGARINTDEFYDCFEDELGKKYHCAFTMTNLELGCCLSHIKANEFIIENDLKNVLILEDDAYPLGVFPDVPSFDFDFDINVLFVQHIDSKLYYKQQHQFTTVAYVVRDKVASQKYLNAFKHHGFLCADTPFGDHTFGLNVWCSSNSIFYHDWNASLISQDVKL